MILVRRLSLQAENEAVLMKAADAVAAALDCSHAVPGVAENGLGFLYNLVVKSDSNKVELIAGVTRSCLLFTALLLPQALRRPKQRGIHPRLSC